MILMYIKAHDLYANIFGDKWNNKSCGNFGSTRMRSE